MQYYYSLVGPYSRSSSQRPSVKIRVASRIRGIDMPDKYRYELSQQQKFCLILKIGQGPCRPPLPALCPTKQAQPSSMVACNRSKRILYCGAVCDRGLVANLAWPIRPLSACASLHTTGMAASWFASLPANAEWFLRNAMLCCAVVHAVLCCAGMCLASQSAQDSPALQTPLLVPAQPCLRQAACGVC